MITFPNAKLNIGLNVVEKRADGYHNLQTIFYPIAIEDVLEINPLDGGDIELFVNGTQCTVDEMEGNLVIKAYRALQRDFPEVKGIRASLIKNIPSGAGLGGGSADASFMLKMLNEHFNLQLSDEQLEKYATKLGADCPIFIKNKPVYAEGIGEIFTDIDFSLKGYYLVLVKPETFISTKEAFANIHPHYPEQNLLSVYKKPIEEWKNLIVNDFEDSVFPNHPEIAKIKDSLYEMGAAYASMSGSGSTVYGIFRNPQGNIEEKFEGCYCKCLKL